ncbi:RT0821/Lpp0805 family surface protein [Ancylobacter sp. MQZ15Z-1]|uniref:RT0821/Lpp0805 family surface protein n=1 Tax=Ancylobacter mangrovi TaxID=2972472 RepID=A0A9X2T1L2_9HYPH|nr:RT0821/Lpp0805 family surface protein [Ancylobacter mangrovi]MCS0494827.1 RT0821/Lpp0805 family surface protein [Ancylobacter mangrovi]
MPPALDPLATGSVTPIPMAYSEPIPDGVAPDDWLSARQALAEALSEDQVAPSVPWENYASATRGTVTPIGTRLATAGDCRAFLMSFVRDTSENWLEGEACRTAKGSWKVDQARMLEKG